MPSSLKDNPARYMKPSFRIPCVVFVIAEDCEFKASISLPTNNTFEKFFPPKHEA